MDVVKGQIVSVTRALAGSTLIVDASATDTTLYLDDVAAFNDDGGSVSIDGTVYAYDPLSVDRDANTLTLATGVAGALTAYEVFVAVDPEAPTHHAEVLLTDTSGVTVSARIPFWARDLLREGPRDPDLRESVDLLDLGDDWLVLDIEFRNGERDASTTPIVIVDENGEAVRLGAPGYQTFTNDPVPIRTIEGAFVGVALGDGAVFATSSDGKIHKFDPVTGVENTSGFPITHGGATGEKYTYLTFANGFLWAAYMSATAGSGKIRKFNPATGAETVLSTPITSPGAGVGFLQFGVDTSFVYAAYRTGASAAEIRKYNQSTGAQVTGGGWPIAGDFESTAADDSGSVFATDRTTRDVYKYDSAGVQITSGFPLAGTYFGIAARTDRLYVASSPIVGGNGDIHGFDPATGTEDAPGSPIAGDFFTVAIDDVYLAAVDSITGDLHIFNAAEDYNSSTIDSVAGAFTGHTSDVADAFVRGNLTVRGQAHDIAPSTRWNRSATQNFTTGVQAVVLWNTTTDNGGYDKHWVQSAGVVTFLKPAVIEVTGYIEWDSNAVGFRTLYIYVNGAFYNGIVANAVNGAVTRQKVSEVIVVAAGDTVELQAAQNSGGTRTVAASAAMRVTRLGSVAA